MARSTAYYLARLSNLILEVEAKRQLCEELRVSVEALARTRLVVVEGEAARIEELRNLWNEAMSTLKALHQEKDREKALQHLERLESILLDLQWDLAAEIQDGLRKKALIQDEAIRDYETKLATWAKSAREQRTALNEANAVRAPVRQEEIEVAKVEEQVRQAERKFDEREYLILQKLLADLAESPPAKDPEFVSRIQKATQQAKRFIRQADLLLLRSPKDALKRYPYTVLLRTPSEPGTHGINIQGSSTVVSHDRDEMSETIRKITDGIDRGLRRDFSVRRERSGQTQSPATPAAPGVTPVAAPQAGPDTTRGFELDPEPSDSLQRENLGELIHDVGDLMYRILMPEQMQNYLYESPCSITITTNDLELPWELMSFRDSFLCLERPLARMPMGRAFPRASQLIRGERKLRFLLIYSDPNKNLPAAKTEIENIDERLKSDWKDYIEIEVVRPEDASGRKLNEVLRKGTFDVIHYAGHAYFDTEDGDLSGLLLYQEEHFLAQKIRRLTGGRPLVFLNACQSGRAANESEPQQVGEYLQAPAEGLASSFIYGGALGCIGALWPIYDDAAADFAVSFYNYVLRGHMIGEAMRLARIEIKEKYPHQITWAAFVLYGDPTFRL